MNGAEGGSVISVTLARSEGKIHYLVLSVSENQGCTSLFCLVHEDFCHAFLSPFAHDGRDAWLDDACFLAGNLLQCVAQKLYMVKADVCDDAYQGLDDVGAVHPASQTHFNYRYVHVLLSKILQGKSRGKFKE